MFTEQDFKFIEEVFSLARMQVVNSQPKNRQALENVMNYEAILTAKLTQVNEAIEGPIEDVNEESIEKENSIIATEVLNDKNKEEE